MRVLRPVVWVGRTALIAIGSGTVVVTGCLVLGIPIPVAELVTETSAPIPASAIVCVGGGLSSDNIPLADAWKRIYTAVQLSPTDTYPRSSSVAAARSKSVRLKSTRKRRDGLDAPRTRSCWIRSRV